MVNNERHKCHNGHGTFGTQEVHQCNSSSRCASYRLRNYRNCYILRNCGSILSNACSARHWPWWPWMMTRAAYQLGWQWYMHRSMSGPWTVRRYAPYAWYAQADLWQGQKISRDVKICQDMLQLWSFPCHLHDFKNNQLALSLATSKGFERVKSPFCKLR